MTRKTNLKRNGNGLTIAEFGHCSHPQAFLKFGVLINFAKLARKHLCYNLTFFVFQCLFFFKKKRLQQRCFPLSFAKELTKLFLENSSERLLPQSPEYINREVQTFSKLTKKLPMFWYLHYKNLKMFSCIPVEEEDLYSILSTSSLNFVFQADQTTVLLWRNSTLYLLENS